MFSFIVPPLKESLVFSFIVPPLVERFVFLSVRASLKPGERVQFICYLLQPFLFSSWSGVSFVLINFYRYTSVKHSY